MKRKRILLFLSVLLALSSKAFALDIENAFSSEISIMQEEYAKKYGWEEEKILTSEWESNIDGVPTTFKRLASYQDYFLEDNILTTGQYLGIIESIRDNTSINQGNNFMLFAKGKIKTKKEELFKWYYGDNAKVSENSDFSAIFISKCASEKGLLDNGIFIKTANGEVLYNHLNSKGYKAYNLSATETFGGSGYKATSGDILFIFNDKGKIKSCGIVVSSNQNKIVVISTDEEKVSLIEYKKNEKENLDGQVFHILYE